MYYSRIPLTAGTGRGAEKEQDGRPNGGSDGGVEEWWIEDPADDIMEEWKKSR